MCIIHFHVLVLAMVLVLVQVLAMVLVLHGTAWHYIPKFEPFSTRLQSVKVFFSLKLTQFFPVPILIFGYQIFPDTRIKTKFNPEL